MNAPWSIRRLPAVDAAILDGLADVLVDCVEGGASVSFMEPMTREKALAFWRRHLATVSLHERGPVAFGASRPAAFDEGGARRELRHPHVVEVPRRVLRLRDAAGRMAHGTESKTLAPLARGAETDDPYRHYSFTVTRRMTSGTASFCTTSMPAITCPITV